MGRQLVTACMFCLLCATHAHCSSHHDSNSLSFRTNVADSQAEINYESGRGTPILSSVKETGRRRRDATKQESEDYVTFVFKQFGDGETMSKAGFHKLLDALGLPVHHSLQDSTIVNPSKKSSSNRTCVDAFTSVKNDGVTKLDYAELCPRIVYHLVSGGCGDGVFEHGHHHLQHRDGSEEEESEISVTAAWVYASVSVVLISLCGLLAVAVIPVMQKSVYQGLVQFLVALAVGTLCGDALLHLLPHAMMSHHIDHSHSHSEGEEDQHAINLWRGFVASLAIVFFYFTEKCLSVITDWKKRHQRKNKVNTRVRVMREDNGTNEETRVGEKLCKHKYSSYPYCYGEITNSADVHPTSGEAEINNISKIREENGTSKAPHEAEVEIHKEDAPNSEKKLLEPSGEAVDYTTIILREHETRHHGHAHTHGHVHSAPGSMGSVAWMVVMGDGLHNLTDGLAIGAAFAANIGGGVSTAVAVFCHELPHEIGDFAVLLKAGMSAKQAVFYNVLSSILCLVGMSIGVILGHNPTVQQWVFSGAAGMFLYIALVDMIPELTSNHSKEGGSLCQCLVQLMGFMSGVGIMLLIAIYEHDLMTAFQNSF